MQKFLETIENLTSAQIIYILIGIATFVLVIIIVFLRKILIKKVLNKSLAPAIEMSKNDPQLFIANFLDTDAVDKENILKEFQKFREFIDFKFGKFTPSANKADGVRYEVELNVRTTDGAAHLYNATIKAADKKNKVVVLTKLT